MKNSLLSHPFRHFIFAGILGFGLTLVGCGEETSTEENTPPAEETSSEPLTHEMLKFNDQVPPEGTAGIVSYSLDGDHWESRVIDFDGIYKENSYVEWNENVDPQTLSVYCYDANHGDGRSLIFSGKLNKEFQTDGVKASVYLPGEIPALDHSLVNPTLAFSSINLEKGYLKGDLTGTIEVEDGADTLRGSFMLTDMRVNRL